MKLLKQLIVTALLLFTGHQWGEAIWVFGKAQVAQLLIAKAWQSTLEAERGQIAGSRLEARVKPWAWSDSWPVARLQWQPGQNGTEKIDHSVQADLYVLAGAHGSSLAFGPGHLDGTAAPGAGLSVIAGHRDTHFRFLEQVALKDVIRLQDSQGSWKNYQVLHTEVRNKDEHPLVIDDSYNGVLLITCYPFDAINAGGPLRYLVWAAAVDSDDSDTKGAFNKLEKEVKTFSI